MEFMSPLAVYMVNRDVRNSAGDEQGEESEGNGDIEADGGMSAENGDFRGIGRFEVLLGCMFVAKSEEMEELAEC